MPSPERREIALDCLRLAGNYLRQKFRNPLGIHLKEESSEWVSDADLGAEKLILERIRLVYADDGILSEESQEKKGNNQFRWIVDPLDGTHNFLEGLHDFGCGLAIEKNGEIIFGASYFPMYDQMFWAEKGKGAFCNGEVIKVSQTTELAAQMVFLDSNLRVFTQLSLEAIKVLVEAGCSIRVNGCSHLNLAWVASGKALAMISRSGKKWDLSPGSLIIREAGGKATNEDNEDWSPASGEMIASNGFIHSRLIELIRRK